METWECELVSFVFLEKRSGNLLQKTFPKSLHRWLFFVIDSSLGRCYPVLRLEAKIHSSSN